MDNITTCAGRVMLSLIFIVAGFGKITGYAATAGYMESKGVSGLLLPLVILLELGGGLLILVGLQTRVVAFLLAGFCVLSAFIFHAGPEEFTSLLKNLALAGGFLTLFAHGPGHWSLDEKFSSTRTESH